MASGTPTQQSPRRVRFATPQTISTVVPSTPQSLRQSKVLSALPAYRRRASRVHEAMSTLQSTPSKIGPWTNDSMEILSDNIRVILSASQTTPELEEMRGITENARLKAIENKRELKSRKRLRHEAVSDSSDSEDGRQQAGSKRLPRNLKRIKRLKLTSSGHTNPAIAIKVLDPQPICINYKQHPLEERTDEWYNTQFKLLYRKVEKFAEFYFGIHELGVDECDEFYEPWAVAMTPEFITWVEMVAEADPVAGGWDALLRTKKLRVWLIMAVIMRVLRIKVFDKDLWGADEEEKKLLMGLERSLLAREGFERTELRSATVRTIISERPVTQNFYSEVASLTAQVSILLKPLSDFLYGLQPLDLEKTLPKFEDQYQSLHNIISTAAYLSLCIRLSATIFKFDAPALGQPYDPKDQWNLDMEGYTESKQAVVDGYNEKREAWEKKLNTARATMQELEDAGKQESRAGQAATQSVVDILAEQPQPPHQTHHPMAKMSIWPGIMRYKPGSDEDDLHDIPLNEKDGMRLVPISKAGMLIYHGEKDRSKRARLMEHVETKKKILAGSAWKRHFVATALFVAAAGWIFQEVLLENTGIVFNEGFASILEMVGTGR